MSFSFFLAKRFYSGHTSDRHRKASTLAIRIATVGVALGIAVMVVSVCVVKGYQNEVRARLMGFASPVEVLDQRSSASPENYPIIADKSMVKAISALSGVKGVQRVSEKMGILKTNDAFQTIMLKGVGKDYDLSFLKSQMVEGKMPEWKSEDGGSNDIVISRKQADALNLKVGSKVYAYFISDDIKLRRLHVAGIYETYISQFDNYYVWADEATVAQLNGWEGDECSILEVKTESLDDMPQVQVGVNKIIASITNNPRRISYTTMSLAENPRTASTLEWLKLLDFNVVVILALMIGVAGFTMVSGLLILILERTRTIGILKSLGATNTRVRHTFIVYAMLIVLRGLIYGNIVGLGIVALQKYFHMVSLNPATYYVSAVPVEFPWIWVVALNIATLAITTLALVIPSFVVSRIQPAKAVRFE